MVSFLLGKLVFKKKYSALQFASVLLISLGIFMALTAEAESQKNQRSTNLANKSMEAAGQDYLKRAAEADEAFSTWLFGIFVLTVALVLSSVLGFIQDMGNFILFF